MGLSLKSLNPFSSSSFLNPLNVINPLTGLGIDIPGAKMVDGVIQKTSRFTPSPIPGYTWEKGSSRSRGRWTWTAVPLPGLDKINEKLPGGDVVNSQLGMLSSLAEGDLAGAKEAFKEGDAAIRDDAKKAIEVGKDVNQALLEAHLKPAEEVAQKILPEEYANKPLQDLTGINNLVASDLTLAADTRNFNSGLTSKEDRVAATRENADAINTIRMAGAMAAATGIPIVSWIGVAANAVANQRMREADLISSRQGIANFGGAALGAYSGMNPGGGLYQQAATGAARGALGAYAGDGNVLQGAALGAIGGAAGPLGQQIGGPGGAAVTGALGNTAGAYARGERGSGLWEAAAQGGVMGAAGNLAGQYGGQGLARTTTGALGGLFRGGSQGALEGGITGALTGYGGEFGGRTGSMVGGLFARELFGNRNQTPTVSSIVNPMNPQNAANANLPINAQQRPMYGLSRAPQSMYANRGGLFGRDITQAGLNRSYLMG